MNTSPRTIARTLSLSFSLMWRESDAFVRRQFIRSLVLLVVAASLGALYPVLYKLTIDSLGGHTGWSAVVAVAILIALLAACNLAIGLSAGFKQLTHGLGVQRLNRHVSDKLFAHIVRLPLRFHLDAKAGATAETVSQGLNACQVLLQHVVFTFLPVTIEFLLIVAVLSHFGRASYLAILGIAAILYGRTFWKASQEIAAPARRVSSAHLETQATLTDSLMNCEAIKYFDAEASVRGRFGGGLIEKEKAWGSLLRLKASQAAVLSAIFTASLAACLGLAGYEVLQGTMTVGDFVLINTYAIRLVQPLEAFGTAAREVSQALAYVERMLDVFEEPSEPSGGIAQLPSRSARGSLTFEHVTFSYRAGRSALDDVSFSVSAGRTLGIVGTSGAGKTSIIRLLFRLYDPDSGRVVLDGVPIAELSLSHLRSSIALVPQDTALFNDTIANNIAFGRTGATRAEIEEAAKLARLEDFIASLPEGYDTRVGERGLKLSGGEKQRVAIARAVLKRPSVYVFDEATSSLDSRTEREILQNILEVTGASTSIVIAHRLSTVSHADEILVLQRGSIAERGNHEQLLALGGAYASLWKAQHRGGTVSPIHGDGFARERR